VLKAGRLGTRWLSLAFGAEPPHYFLIAHANDRRDYFPSWFHLAQSYSLGFLDLRVPYLSSLLFLFSRINFLFFAIVRFVKKNSRSIFEFAKRLKEIVEFQGQGCQGFLFLAKHDPVRGYNVRNGFFINTLERPFTYTYTYTKTISAENPTRTTPPSSPENPDPDPRDAISG
jgi:hypothetical protein